MELIKQISNQLVEKFGITPVRIDKERIYKSFVEWKQALHAMFPNLPILGDVYGAKADGIAKWNGQIGIIYNTERKLPAVVGEEKDMSILKSIVDILHEEKNEHGDRMFRTYPGWKRAVKKHKPDAKFYGDKDIGGAHDVGEWDGEKGYIISKKEEVKEETDKSLGSYLKVIAERPLTTDEKDKKEDIVNSLRDKSESFIDKYGKKAKSVMYATATKLAKK